MKDVKDKVAFVTGGASGIGFGIVRTLLAAGMKVVVADIRKDHLERAAGELKKADAAHFIQLDVTDRAAFAAAADEAGRVFGKVHVVCNNAGVAPFGDATKVTFDDWDWTLSVNLGGAINGVQTFLPRLLAHGEEAHIVNTTSVAGILPMPGGIAYVTAKHAITGLTEGLRSDLGLQHRIGVTLLVPGPVVTNIHEVAKLRPAKYAHSGIKQAEEEMLQRKAPGTWMDPLDAGAMVLDGIQRRLPFVITHGQFKTGTLNYFNCVIAGFPPVPAGEENADLGFGVSNPIYAEILSNPQPPAQRRRK
jgi:NAD(P)-dependent dehydrogenase (short-subunit alcohol dehydrogenase family)